MPAVATARHYSKLPAQSMAAAKKMRSRLGEVEAELGNGRLLSQSLASPLQKGIKIPESFDLYVRFTNVFSVYL